MKSSFFHGDRCLQAAEAIRAAINAEPDFLSALTAASPRAVGDAVQELVAQKFEGIVGDWSREYFASFSRRTMEDLAFKDQEGFYCAVDIKTHREDADFSMPALVSVRNLARFYEDDMNIFSVLMVKYRIVDNRLQANEVIFCPIEFLDWDCLTVGALGWGQIQLANSNNIIIRRGQSRKQWMLTLCDKLRAFYPKEIRKIQGRVKHFDAVKSTWQNKLDVWG